MQKPVIIDLVLLVYASSALRLSSFSNAYETDAIMKKVVTPATQNCDGSHVALVPDDYPACYDDLKTVAQAKCVSEMHAAFRNTSTITCGRCVEHEFTQKICIEPLFAGEGENKCDLWIKEGEDPTFPDEVCTNFWHFHENAKKLGVAQGGNLCFKNGTKTRFGEMVAASPGLGKVDLLTLFSCFLQGVKECPQADLAEEFWPEGAHGVATKASFHLR